MAQAADVYTEPIASEITWSRSMRMIGMHDDVEAWKSFNMRVWSPRRVAAPASCMSSVAWRNCEGCGLMQVSKVCMFCGDVFAKSIPRVRAAPARLSCVPPSALVPERVSTHARAMAPTWKNVIEWATRAVLRLFDRDTYLALAGETPGVQSLETAVSSIPFVPGNPYPWTSAVLGEISNHLDEPGVDVPETASKAKVLWIGDSGTRIYKTTEAGRTKSRVPVAEIKEAFPLVELSIHGLSGFTPKDLAARVEKEDPGAWDLVVLSTYLNGILKNGNGLESPPSWKETSAGWATS